MTQRVLYIVSSGAPPAADIATLVTLAQAQRWTCCCIASPQATTFMDIATLETLTGFPVRSTYKQPGTPDVFPSPQAILVAPATFNSINKIALGIADTLATSIVCEYLSQTEHVPIVVAPCLKSALMAHPAFQMSVNTLAMYGVRILHDPITHPAPDLVSWLELLNAFEQR